MSTIDITGRTLETIRAIHIRSGAPIVGDNGRVAMIGRFYFKPNGRRWSWGIRFVTPSTGVERFEDGSRFEPVEAVA